MRHVPFVTFVKQPREYFLPDYPLTCRAASLSSSTFTSSGGLVQDRLIKVFKHTYLGISNKDSTVLKVHRLPHVGRKKSLVSCASSTRRCFYGSRVKILCIDSIVVILQCCERASFNNFAPFKYSPLREMEPHVEPLEGMLCPPTF